MGTNYYAVMKKPTIADPIHIGKSSIGWKFLFHTVPGYINYINGEPLNSYNRWISFLKEYTDNDTIVIMNEYDEEVSLSDLIELVQRKQLENNDDNFKHCDNVGGYRFKGGDFS
nr:MAG TPA_asm: hypothetical protein [Caudoviricetes sp.]